MNFAFDLPGYSRKAYTLPSPSWDPEQDKTDRKTEATWGEGALSHLILLGELEPIVGFEALNIVRQVGDGNGRVVSHTWGRWSTHTGGVSVSSEQGGRDSPRHVL